MKLVSLRDILRFYIPLVLNSQMMTLSGPIINKAVGNDSDATLQLAAYWIGFTLLMFLESPCLAIQQITSSLVDSGRMLRHVVAYSMTFAALAVVGVLAVAFTPLGDLVFDHVVKTTPRVAELSRWVLGALAPVPVLISLRGIGNGIAIRQRQTVLVARATLFRLLALSSVVGVVVLVGTGSGAFAGVAALEAGIALETAVIWIGVRRSWRRGRPWTDTPVARPRLERDVVAKVLRVALPLAVSSISWTAFRPLLNAILGRLSDPELAQAGFGFIMPLVLLTSSPLWTIQNVSLVLPESGADLRRVIRFAAAAAVFFAGFIVVLTLTPIRSLVLDGFYDLTPELEQVVVPALILLVLEPFFLAARSVSQGLLIKAQRTDSFMVVSPIKTVLVAIVGFGVVHQNPDVNGVVLGTLLFLGGDCFEAIMYSLQARRLLVERILFGEVPRRESAAVVTP